MNLNCDNIKMMMNGKAEEVIEKLLKSIKERYQYNLEKMEGRQFVFGCVHLLFYKCHKVNLNCGGS